MKEIVAAYNDKGDVKAVQSKGLHVANDKYVVLKADDRSLYGRKVRVPTDGIRIQAMLMALYYREKKVSSSSRPTKHCS